uniref:Uncharacterized protein n=1 Tax=Sphaerodactylus townsendi TaxID=933632 RepID=A0ACB8ETU7_9SAUR
MNPRIPASEEKSSDPAEGPQIPLGSATGGEAPTAGGFLDSINQFMTAPLDGSQGVTVRRRRGLDYRESQPLGFGSVTWATAPLAGNVSLPIRPSEGADLLEAETWRMLQVSEEAWDSEREEYLRALRHMEQDMEQDMEHLRAALSQARQVAPAPGAGVATTPATLASAQPVPAPAQPIQPGPALAPVPAQPAQPALVPALAPVPASALVPAQPVQPGLAPAPVPAQSAQPALVPALAPVPAPSPGPAQPVHPGPAPASIPVPGQPPLQLAPRRGPPAANCTCSVTSPTSDAAVCTTRMGSSGWCIACTIWGSSPSVHA